VKDRMREIDVCTIEAPGKQKQRMGKRQYS
jgi:hypothetical protein